MYTSTSLVSRCFMKLRKGAYYKVKRTRRSKVDAGRAVDILPRIKNRSFIVRKGDVRMSVPLYGTS
jgi:hypothetical protein